MVRQRSRFTPQALGWVEDLPDRESPLEGSAPMLDQEGLNEINDRFMAISRSIGMPRGPALVVGFCGLAVIAWLGTSIGPSMLGEALRGRDSSMIWVVVAVAVASLAVMLRLMYAVVSLPRDWPVIFSSDGRVFVYEKPVRFFQRSKPRTKVFDWQNIQGEIIRKGGRFQRNFLVLVVCKPGTTEVVDRFELKDTWSTTAQYREMWAYVRHYMKYGPAGLPAVRLRRREPLFVPSLFVLVPFLSSKYERTARRCGST